MASIDPQNGGAKPRVFVPTISLGNVIVLVVAIAGGMWTLGGLRADIAALQAQMQIVMADLGIDHGPLAAARRRE